MDIWWQLGAIAAAFVAAVIAVWRLVDTIREDRMLNRLEAGVKELNELLDESTKGTEVDPYGTDETFWDGAVR